MKYSVRLSDAVHMMIFIEAANGAICPSAAIAESIKTNPAYIRQLMMKLRKAGLLQSVQGHATPSLTRRPEGISLLDIYKKLWRGTNHSSIWTPISILSATLAWQFSMR